MHKLCNGKVPPLHAELLDEKDQQLMRDISVTKQEIEGAIESYHFREGLSTVIDLARKGNKFMQEKEPWILAKQLGDNGNIKSEAQKQIDNCLHLCLQLCANLAVYINPFLPFTAKKMLHMMKVVDKILDWENAGKMKLLSVGYSLRAPELLFRKMEDAEVAQQIEKLKTKALEIQQNKPAEEKATTEVVQIKPEIVFDDFAKIDLKTGIIRTAEKVEKADKLLKLSVDLGFETRTIVSGIALHYAPEDIIGKQVVVVTNLAPRKMRGIESNGMILMAEDAQGKLHFVSAPGDVNPGSGVS